MNEEKACPYCGEKILAVAIKCKHCGSDVEGSTSTVKNQFKMSPTFTVILVIVLLIIVAGLFYNWTKTGTLSGNGYSDTDVVSIEQDIRAQFLKQEGIKVEEVKMIIESPKKMTGYVKLRVGLLGVVHKSCSSTLGDNGQSIWECD